MADEEVTAFPRLTPGLFICTFNHYLMTILEHTDSAMTYIGNDNNYYVCISNSDNGAPDDIYPLVLGPDFAWCSHELPF